MSEVPRVAVFHDSSSVSMLEIFEAAHDLCRIVWVVGWSRDQPPLRALGRFGDVVDVTAMGKTESVAHVVATGVSGVVIFNDAPLRLAAQVAERLDLPFHRPPTAELLADKLAQRRAFQRAGLSVPGFAGVRLGDVDVEVTFPAVLKPRVGAGGRDTFRVENREQLDDALTKCGSDEKFILEEWLPDLTTQSGLSADVVSVESVVRDGAVEHFAVTGRFPFAEPFRETGLFLPSDLGASDRDGVIAVAGAAIEALDIRHGLLHTEVKLTPSGPRIVEVNGRLGGGVSRMLLRVGGPSLLVWALRLALGHDAGALPMIAREPVAFYRFIVAPLMATTVENVSGFNELRALPGVEEIRLNRQPGDTVDSRETSHLGHVIRIDGMVESYDELAVLINEQIPATLALTWGYN